MLNNASSHPNVFASQFCFHSRDSIIQLFSFCSSTTFVLKADDNSVLDLYPLINTLKKKYESREPSDLVIECPSPFRNDRPIILPLIGGYNTLRGKWALRADECDRTFFPDFWDSIQCCFEIYGNDVRTHYLGLIGVLKEFPVYTHIAALNFTTPLNSTQQWVGLHHDPHDGTSPSRDGRQHPLPHDQRDRHPGGRVHHRLPARAH